MNTQYPIYHRTDSTAAAHYLTCEHFTLKIGITWYSAFTINPPNFNAVQTSISSSIMHSVPELHEHDLSTLDLKQQILLKVTQATFTPNQYFLQLFGLETQERK